MTAAAPSPIRSDVVTGVQLSRGIGVQPAKGFWAAAWDQVLKRPAALLALTWLGIVAFFAVFAPVIASGHPIFFKREGMPTVYPLWENLRSLDLLILFSAIAAVSYIFFGGHRKGRVWRMWGAIGGFVLAVAVVAISQAIQSNLERAAVETSREALRTGVQSTTGEMPFARREHAGYIVGAGVALSLAIIGSLLPIGKPARRIAICTIASLAAMLCVGARWKPPLERFDYIRFEASGEARSVYTIIPWSPNQRFSALSREAPGTVLPADTYADDAAAATTLSPRRFLLGTDAFGADVLSQILHACRLAISIGLVSTTIALIIGVTMGALMGYFGGWVDLLLYRVVEVFMAVPVLFLLIVAVAVLPDELKTTYVIMGIIGCFTWTGMARFTRAEFMKLRNQDFVQSAQAAGLPLRSVLFKHMLPNGVAPVLVDTSFAVAAAISIEAILSYLGLGPIDSPSWGKLLSSAISSEGEFKWWLAAFPGIAIFFTVLSYNFLGEALRDAIDPKLKKARV